MPETLLSGVTRDRLILPRVTRDAAGFYTGIAPVTRTGIFEYGPNEVSVSGPWNREGRKVRLLRHPDDVFAQASLDSLKLIPLTVLHPAGDEDVTPVNARNLSVGTTGETITHDERLVYTSLKVTAQDAIDAIASGEYRELSCGYTRALDMTPGEWEGQPYDGRMTNIDYNHIAFVPLGRAGSDVRLTVDRAHPSQESPMLKLTIDSVDYEVPPQVEVEYRKVRDAADALQKQVDTLTGELTGTKSALAQATSEEAIRVRVTERSGIIAAARDMLTKEQIEKIPSLSNREIMLAAIKRAYAKDAALCKAADEGSEEMMKGLFQALISLLGKAFGEKEEGEGDPASAGFGLDSAKARDMLLTLKAGAEGTPVETEKKSQDAVSRQDEWRDKAAKAHETTSTKAVN